MVGLALLALDQRLSHAHARGEDWRTLPTPPILWLNTALLAAGSVALHGRAARRRPDAAIAAPRRPRRRGGRVPRLPRRPGRSPGAQLADVGIVVAGNPAAAFFYLLTALHGLHLVGGLVALGRTIRRAATGADDDRARLSVDLCATYWHALLLVWLVLFGILFLAPWTAIEPLPHTDRSAMP